MGGLLVTMVLLGAAGVSAWRGGIGGMFYTPFVTGARVQHESRLRGWVWVGFALTYLLLISVYRSGGTGVMLLQLGLLLLQWIVWFLLFWGVLRLLQVRIGARALATAAAAGTVPHLPFVVGVVVATWGAMAWFNGAPPTPKDWPGIGATVLLLLASATWSIVATTASVAAASGASRWRVAAAWLGMFAVTAVLGAIALLLHLVAQANH